MTIYPRTPGRSTTLLAGHRLRMPMLMLALALGGCAATDPGPQSGRSPLVTYTSVGSGQPKEAPSYGEQADTAPPAGRRALPPIQQRPAFEDDVPAPRAGGAQGERTTLNFNEAELQGVLRALAQFTGRNFVVDPRVKGQLTLMSDTPVDADTAYSMLLGALRMQGFAVIDVD